MTHEYSNMLLPTADHWSLCRARRIQPTNSTKKAWLGNIYV